MRPVRSAWAAADRLVAEHGPDPPVGAMVRALVGDCPNCDARERERCDPYAPELLEFFGKALAPE